MKVNEGVLRDAVKARLMSTGTAQSRGLNSLDCEVLALHALDAVLGDGWRIVKTDAREYMPLIAEEYAP